MAAKPGEQNLLARQAMGSHLVQDEGTQPSLSEELRTATRQKHHVLNNQIIARLPLCLPPHAESPLDYAAGMIVFGQIYFAFEEVFVMYQASSDQRMHAMYERMHLPQLFRTSRLRNDIAALESRLLRGEVEQLETLAQESKLFSQRIQGSLARRPHIMLAYTWTMYLALFNGGRWIRRQLISAGGEFWRGEALPLSFWDFGKAERDDFDEDQLKDTFKVKYGEATSLLTNDERRDVVDETKRLFDLCSELVRFLDQKTPPMAASIDACPESPRAGSCTSTDAVTGTLRTCMTSAYALLKITTSTPRKDKIRSSN